MVRSFRSRRKSYRKNLSTKRIFSKRSSLSQARQIYALKRKVSAMNRRLRPEVKTLYHNAESFTLSSDQIGNTFKSWVIDMPPQGTGESERIGDLISLKNIQLNFTFEYYNNSSTGYHDSESSGAPLRIIVGQFKSAGNYQSPPSINGVLEEYGGSGAAYTNQVLSPLRKSQTEFSRILLDKRFVMTTSRNQRIMRLNVRPKNYRINSNDSVNKVWIMIISSGLHYDNDFTERFACTLSYKMAYTDS